MLKVLLVFLGIPAGIALIVLGGMTAANESGLQKDGKVVEATITDSRTDEQSGYQVRYEFRVGSAVFSNADATGRKNLWTTLSKRPAANKASVRYLPRNPWVNHPVDSTGNPMESALVALATGVVLECIGLFLLASDIQNWRKKRSPAAAA